LGIGRPGGLPGRFLFSDNQRSELKGDACL
jgi:hypothetical protein